MGCYALNKDNFVDHLGTAAKILSYDAFTFEVTKKDIKIRDTVILKICATDSVFTVNY